MAAIQTYAQPTWLYRFRSLRQPGARGDDLADPQRLEEELAAIAEGYIWTATFKEMNDPMEGFYRPSSLVRRKSGYDEFVEALHSEKLGIGIAALSESWSNELMWAHYADGFRGICVVYKMAPLLSGLNEGHTMARVVYGDRPHYLNLRSMRKADDRARSILSTKNLNWSYEREWRLFSPHPGRADHGPGVVPTVYLGMRMDSKDRQRIKERLSGVAIRVRRTVVDGYSVKRLSRD